MSAEDRDLLVKTEPPLVHGLEQRQCQSDDPAVVVQVWSLTQFYSVDFSQSRIGVKKCVFNKRKIQSRFASAVRDGVL